MDLSVYITELLNEHGTISIPHIGVFTQVRKRGYYNTDEGKLYPPYFQTEFEQKPVADDRLLQHLIEKSKVSAASARFFMDRYVQNILQQAELGEAMIGKLGWLSKDFDKLTFRPAFNENAASAAFGFAPVSVTTETEPVAEQVQVEPQTEVPPVTPEPTPVVPETAPAISQTAPVINEVIPPVAETVVEPLVPAEPEAPVVPVTEPVAPAVTFSIEKELAQQPEPAPEPVAVAAPQPKAPISPLVRQHKPADKPKPVAEPDAPAPIVAQTPQPPVTPPVKPEVVEEEYEPAKPFYLKPWFYGAAVLVILAAGAIFVLNKNKADYSKTQPSTAAPVVKSSPSTDSIVVKKVAPDTVVIRSQPVKDSTVKNQPLPASTEFAPEIETPVATATHPVVNSNNYKFVLIGGSYGTYEQALAACGRYKTAGISASPFENTRKLWKVALGYYKTYTEGQDIKRELVRQGKVLNWKLYVETIRK